MNLWGITHEELKRKAINRKEWRTATTQYFV